MKEGKSKKKVRGKTLYFTVLGRLEKNTNLTEIQKELNISKQHLYYYLRRLRNDGLIANISRGYWEVNKGVEHPTKRSKNIRGHAFIWTIKLDRKYNWIQKLKKFNIKYKLIRNSFPRIFIKNRKVWLGKKTITIYESHSFYGENAIQSRKYAVISLLEILDVLERKIHASIKRLHFKPVREHYGMIKNDLAQQCNRQGDKIYVRDDLDGEWMWVDDSVGMHGELETGGKGITKDRAELNLEVQKWYNDHKKHNFKVTPSFLLENINNLSNVVSNNQQMISGLPVVLNDLKTQISSHLRLIKEYRKENKVWRNIKEREIKKLKSKEQLKLSKWL